MEYCPSKPRYCDPLIGNEIISQRNSQVEDFDKNNHELLVVVVPNTLLPLQSSLCLSSLLLELLSQQIWFMCNRVSYKDTNCCDELTSAVSKLPEGNGIVWLCNGEPTLDGSYSSPMD